MIYLHRVIILASCMLFCDLAHAAECLVTINPRQMVYELPKNWYFAASDNPEYRDLQYIKKTGVIFSPYDNWNDHADYKHYTGNSWYGLTINCAKIADDYALFIPWQSRGTQVYLNGALIHETRTFDKYSATPGIIGKPSLVTVPGAACRHGDNSLVLRTGSLNNIGGITYPILFGRYESILLKWNQFIIWNCFLSAIDIFLFIYFMIIAYKRKKEKYYLYFSFLALSLGAWIMGYKGIILFIIDRQSVFIVSTYFASVVASLSFINFISHFFNISRKESFVTKGLITLHLVFIASITLEYIQHGAIENYQKYLYDPFMMIVVLTVLYGMYLCTRAVITRQPYSKRILFGVAVYSMAFLLSLPIFLNIFAMEPILIEGFFIMTTIFATVLASRFAQVHNDLEGLNINLTEINNEKDRAIDNLNIYKYIVSESRDHMAFIDAGGRFIEVNNALLKAYGRKRSGVINQTVSEIFGNEEYETSIKEHFEACLSGEPIVFERWQEFPPASRRYMITSLLPYRAGSEQKVGIVYYSIDITDRIMFEQELVKISENERNAIGIELHDNLAQKLFGIALKSSVLAGDIEGKRKDGALEIEGLINEAIAYVRNIAKSLSRVDFIAGGLASLLNELKNLMERRYKVELDIVIDCDIDIINRIYYSQIYYIMQEAVINSVKHSGAKVIRVRVQRSGNDIQLLIKDDGIGIPDRIDNGKGIGLKIMKYRARMIGSSLSIRRGSEGGTEVICTIPALGAG
jgi:PAS domain S-box-containing protein